jgi:DNA repair protein RecO (recombination protein O)
MLIKTRAIVLHHVKYGESSLIVTLYTEKHGRMTCIVSGIRSKKTHLSLPFFQPLTLIEAEIYHKSNREVHRLKELSCPFHYTSIPFSITKSTISLFLSELLWLTLREEEANEKLFDFLFHAFQLLDSKDEGVANFHLLFLIHYSRYLGIFPADPESVTDMSRFTDLKIFTNLPGETGRIFMEMLKTSLAEGEKISLNKAGRLLLLDALVKYYEEHLDGMGKIRSVAVLKEIFSDSL